jgi:prolyl oligopeptidase
MGKEQNAVTFSYLDKIPYRAQIKNRLTETWNYPKYSAPFKKGEFYFYGHNNGLQNQSVIYKMKGLNGKPEVFIDPNSFSTDGTVSLTGMSFSNDNKYCAYSIARSGSDWQEMFILEVATGKLQTDIITWVKFGGAAWYKDGFYYSRYPMPEAGLEFSAASQQQKIYYHKLGTSQNADRLVF